MPGSNHLVVAVVFGFLSSAQAGIVIHVDVTNCPGGSGTAGDPYCSIQAAIDSAVDSDEILVAPGTYYETIDFQGKTIALRSLGGSELTTIDGTGHAPVVQIVGAEGTGTLLDGFTVTGGNADDVACCEPGSFGGGLYIKAGSPSVINCRFRGNSAAGFGGGVYLEGSVSTFSNCSFTANTAQMGAGLATGPLSFVTVSECTFRGNYGWAGGGGVWFGSDGYVDKCVFDSNRGHYMMGGLGAVGSDVSITDSLFVFNDGGLYGGAMLTGGRGRVVNSLFISNLANMGAAHMSVGEYDFSNCTFFGHLGETVLDSTSDSPTTTIANSIVWKNGPKVFQGAFTVRYSDIQGGHPGPGNIDADPSFTGPTGSWTHEATYDPVTGLTTFTDATARFEPGELAGKCLRFDPTLPKRWRFLIVDNTEQTISVWGNWYAGDDYIITDFRLSADSPCIDAGDSTAVPPDITTDIEGNPRVLDVPGVPDTGYAPGGGPVVDMGAFESPGFEAAIDPGAACDLNGDGVVGVLDLLLLLGQMGTCTGCQADLDADGVVCGLDVQIMFENWGWTAESNDGSPPGGDGGGDGSPGGDGDDGSPGGDGDDGSPGGDGDDGSPGGGGDDGSPGGDGGDGAPGGDGDDGSPGGDGDDGSPGGDGDDGSPGGGDDGGDGDDGSPPGGGGDPPGPPGGPTTE